MAIRPFPLVVRDQIIDHPQLSKPLLNLRQGHRVIVPAIDPDIEGAAYRGSIPVAMAIEVIGAVMALVPLAHGVVEQDDQIIAVLDLRIRLRTCPCVEVPDFTRIVVPPDEMFPAPQLRQKIFCELGFPGEVPKKPNVIVICYPLIPTNDQVLIHNVYVGVRSLAEINNPAMA
jgi:hypothetical protein